MKTWFFDNPRLLATALLLLIVAGMSSMATIVRQEDPTITNGIAVITTPFPGASAERVESLVTEKIEDELREVTEIQTLSSISARGVSVVTVEIDETIIGDATEPVFSKIRDRLDDAQRRFPAGVRPSDFDNDRFGSYIRLEALVWRSAEAPSRGLLKRYAEELQDRFRNVPGTDSVRVFGAPDEEIRVEFEPGALDGAGVPAAFMASALARADAKVTAGLLRGPGHDIPIEVRGELDSLDRIRQVPFLTSPSGAVLRVGDVARVERTTVDPPRQLAVVDGETAVIVGAQLARGRRYDLWTQDAMAMLADYRQQLPQGIELRTLFDQAEYTTARLTDLNWNLATGLAIVVAVLLFTLGYRSAMIVSLTLPLVMLTSVAVLRAGGIPIHQMSVTGLIVALGLLVDNAIVMTDSIRSKRLKGKDRRTAVLESVDHLAVPLFSSTLTTVLAFMPIILLSGRVGEFVGTIGLSVIIALITSYGLAMTVVPALAGRVLPDGSETSAGVLTRGLRYPALTAWFDRSLSWSLRRPRLSMALASVLPLIGFAGASTLPRQFFPPADRDQFFAEVWMKPSTSIDGTHAALDEIDAILRADDRVESVSWVLGKSAPPFYYNMKQDKDGQSSFAQALVETVSVDAVGELLAELQPRIDAEVPRAQVILRELLQGPPVDAPIEYRIYGPDIRELRRLGDELRQRLSRVAAVTHTTASLTAGSPKLWIEPDEAEAQLAGLSLVDIAEQMSRHLEGLPAGSVLEGTEELPVRVRAVDTERDTATAVRAIAFHPPRPSRLGSLAPGGVGVPLESLGATTLAPTLDRIPHRDGTRVNIIRGYTQVGVFPETALRELESVLSAHPLDAPPGYRIQTGGDAEERSEAMSNLFTFVPVLVVLMVAAVALSLSSFRLGGVVFAVALQSIGLGLFSLVVVRHPLGFQGMIGLIGLVGVAINAAIIINSALRADPASVAGNPGAIRRVVLEDTSRHIVSTTITTFGGFLPLMLAPGGFWPPFATGIAGGVLLSTVVSFYFVPAAFLLVTRRRPVLSPAALPGAVEVPA